MSLHGRVPAILSHEGLISLAYILSLPGGAHRGAEGPISIPYDPLPDGTFRVWMPASVFELLFLWTGATCPTLSDAASAIAASLFELSAPHQLYVDLASQPLPPPTEFPS